MPDNNEFRERARAAEESTRRFVDALSVLPRALIPIEWPKDDRG